MGNGTFFNNFNLPVVWATRTDAELDEDGDRKNYGLPPQGAHADRDDPKEQQRQLHPPGLRLHHLPRHGEHDAPTRSRSRPGYLEKEWTENGRRYFRYEMDQPILNFFSVLSARYEVKEDTWNDVKLEIYYHPTHTATSTA